MDVSTQRQVTVAELKRAWDALQAGAYQDEQPYAAQPGTVEPLQARGGRVIPVLGCGGGVGASTTALALALAIDAPCALIDAAPATASGLAGASTAELGQREAGWSQGTRAQVIISRIIDTVAMPVEVPAPPAADRDIDATVIDLGWPPEILMGQVSWLRDLVVGTDPLVLVASATLPGLRRLESTLTLLAGHRDAEPTLAAVLGPRLPRWPKPVRRGMGPRSRRLEQEGRIVALPCDRRLAVTGLDTAPLPPPLLAAACAVLDLLPAPASMKGSTAS
ncbi:hypothetical protein N864_16785 [Intrasporangium chromatireducens Q5-1]|uniref:Uncharacterized protein n=1 Tax=Intrasporangium chromatireducens Q5-1 TaxID=584657 RepID=W9GKM1_9MICO|nr:hypothetical protein [Intrasporangium chromatireducens]EWT06811.1 hypothetical protein N864_16785 [Intrasporangium chromatireducens Q5-1]